MQGKRETAAHEKGTRKKSEEGWTPEVSGVTKKMTKEERSLDIGGSGQFAPGGYYNQRRATKPDRIDLDEIIVPRRHAGEKK
jgi:hypothetical protein